MTCLNMHSQQLSHIQNLISWNPLLSKPTHILLTKYEIFISSLLTLFIYLFIAIYQYNKIHEYERNILGMMIVMTYTLTFKITRLSLGVSTVTSITVGKTVINKITLINKNGINKKRIISITYFIYIYKYLFPPSSSFPL